MPEFKARDEPRESEKRRELASFIEVALAHKARLAPLDDAAIPRIEAFGRKAPSPLLNSDRGGAIPIPTQDPLAAREAGVRQDLCWLTRRLSVSFTLLRSVGKPAA